jgi:hypothetical protein
MLCAGIAVRADVDESETCNVVHLLPTRSQVSKAFNYRTALLARFPVDVPMRMAAFCEERLGQSLSLTAQKADVTDGSPNTMADDEELDGDDLNKGVDFTVCYQRQWHPCQCLFRVRAHGAISS